MEHCEMNGNTMGLMINQFMSHDTSTDQHKRGQKYRGSGAVHMCRAYYEHHHHRRCNSSHCITLQIENRQESFRLAVNNVIKMRFIFASVRSFHCPINLWLLVNRPTSDRQGRQAGHRLLLQLNCAFYNSLTEIQLIISLSVTNVPVWLSCPVLFRVMRCSSYCKFYAYAAPSVVNRTDG